MNDNLNPNTTPDPVEEEISHRLARLRSRPVDLSNVLANVRRELQPHAANRYSLWLSRPIRAIAALLMIAITVLAIVLATNSRPAIASTDNLLRLHEAVVSDASQQMSNVASIAAANAAIRGEWKSAPTLPDVPNHQVMGCSVHKLGSAKAACVLLSIDSVPVTLAAAESDDIVVRSEQPVQRGGRTYEVRSSEGVSMVMTQHNEKWFCLMGRLSPDRLMSFWESLDLN